MALLFYKMLWCHLIGQNARLLLSSASTNSAKAIETLLSSQRYCQI